MFRYHREMRVVSAEWGSGRFAQDLDVAGHPLRADEDVDKGGDNSGPTPHELLLAALASCTTMTLKVYAERKGWPLRNVRAIVNGETTPAGLVITRQLTFEGELDAEQRQRLLEIAERCPVHKSLVGQVTITTTAAAP